jgi:hypothetical protein
MGQLATVAYVHGVINKLKPNAIAGSSSTTIATMRYVAGAIDKANGNSTSYASAAWATTQLVDTTKVTAVINQYLVVVTAFTNTFVYRNTVNYTYSETTYLCIYLTTSGTISSTTISISLAAPSNYKPNTACLIVSDAGLISTFTSPGYFPVNLALLVSKDYGILCGVASMGDNVTIGSSYAGPFYTVDVESYIGTAAGVALTNVPLQISVWRASATNTYDDTEVVNKTNMVRLYGMLGYGVFSIPYYMPNKYSQIQQNTTTATLYSYNNQYYYIYVYAERGGFNTTSAGGGTDNTDTCLTLQYQTGGMAGASYPISIFCIYAASNIPLMVMLTRRNANMTTSGTGTFTLFNPSKVPNRRLTTSTAQGNTKTTQCWNSFVAATTTQQAQNNTQGAYTMMGVAFNNTLLS